MSIRYTSMSYRVKFPGFERKHLSQLIPSFKARPLGGMLKVIGVDILPRKSPGSQSQPHYAVVVVEDGKIRDRIDDVSLSRLLKLIEEEHPDYVAIDNIFELGETTSDVINIIQNLPYGTRLVQVTLVDGNQTYPLSFLAHLNGIPLGEKPSPLKAAEVAALLVFKGVGSIARIYDEKTKIVISKARTLKSGGMSRERYLRRIRTLILRVTRQIKEALDTAGLDYDYFYRRTTAGLDGSVFIVYAERRKLYGIVKPMRGHDINVSIKPIEHRTISFVPIHHTSYPPRVPSRYIIMGVDPGIVAGLAILDIEGRPLYVVSKRYFSRGDMISIAREYGLPVLISTDVSKPPTMVRKLAASLNIPLFTPSRTLSVAEKERIVREYLSKFKNLNNVKVSNSHERDALAAAIKAYLSFKSKFEQAEAKIRELGINISLREVKALIIRGKSISEAINGALKNLKKVKESQDETPAVMPDTQIIESLKAQIRRQNELIERLTRERELLHSRIRELNKRIDQLEELLNLVTSDQALKLKESRMIASLSRQVEELNHELTSARKEISQLRKELEQARDSLKLIARNMAMPIKFVRALTRDSINEAIEEWSLKKGDLLLALDCTTASEDAFRRLSEIKIRAIISLSSPPEHVLDMAIDFEIPIIVLPSDRIIWRLGIPLILDYHKLLSSVKEAEREVQAKARLRNLRELERIIKEYRSERARIL